MRRFSPVYLPRFNKLAEKPALTLRKRDLEKVWFCGRLQPVKWLGKQVRARHRRGYQYADGGKCPNPICLEHLYAQPRSATCHGTSGLSPRRIRCAAVRVSLN